MNGHAGDERRGVLLIEAGAEFDQQHPKRRQSEDAQPWLPDYPAL
jgi:hypothetical protein